MSAGDGDLESLINRARHGDLRAWREIFLRAWRPAYRVAMRLLNDRHLAEDAVQEAFVKAYQNLGQLRTPARFRSWLSAITANEVRRLRQHRHKRAQMDEGQIRTAAAEDVCPAAATARDESVERVRGVIQRLPEPFRTVVVLMVVNGKTDREVQGILGVPIGTVRSRKRRGMRLLKEQLAGL